MGGDGNGTSAGLGVRSGLRNVEDEAMTLAKRYFVRRLVGVGVAAASIVIGVETPALALPPIITSFSPTSGPEGCVVVIEGSNFDNPVVSSVDIGGTPVTAFKIVSATKIWATVAGATSGPIHVTNASDTATSSTDFTNTNPGACSPTIETLTPCAGSAGTTVLITGTNLLKDSGTTTTDAVGGEVRFAPYAATATHTVPNVDTSTSLSVIVPPDTADGSIRVSTFNDVLGEGAVLSEVAFQVAPPEPNCPFPILFKRTVTLHLVKSLVARGKVSTYDATAPAECKANVPVKIQRRVAEGWKTVRTTTTRSTGSYRRRIPDRPGKYRAMAPTVVLSDGAHICTRAISPVRLRG
jgi:hypothetical protein